MLNLSPFFTTFQHGRRGYLAISAVCFLIAVIGILFMGCASTGKPLYVYSQFANGEGTPGLDHVVILNVPVTVHFVGSNQQFPKGCWDGFDTVPAACTTVSGDIYVVGREVDVGMGIRAIDYDHALLGHEFGEILSRIDFRLMKPDLSYKIQIWVLE